MTLIGGVPLSVPSMTGMACRWKSPPLEKWGENQSSVKVASEELEVRNFDKAQSAEKKKRRVRLNSLQATIVCVQLDPTLWYVLSRI